MFNYWIWEQPSWRVLATYPTFAEAMAAAKHNADPEGTWIITRDGDAKDKYLNANLTDRMAYDR
jgi:hypothetical protein